MMSESESTAQQAINDGARESLLTAARELFLKNTYSNISIRKIADKAKVNSAMIAYYFGSKSGLFREMVRSYLISNVELLKANMGHPNQSSMEEVFNNFYKSVPPGLAQLMFRTMVYERSEMRQWLLDNLMSPILSTAEDYFAQMIRQSGKQLDPLVLRTIFQSVLVMPVMIYPTLVEIESEKIPDNFFESLAKTNAAMISNYLEMETKNA